MFDRLRASIARPAACLPLLLGCVRALAAETPSSTPSQIQTLQGDVMEVRSGEQVVRGHARVVFDPWTLTADEIHRDQSTGRITATGHVVLTRPQVRLLAESGSYWPADQRIELTDVRFGRPPLYGRARSAHGTEAELIFDQVELFYGEPGKLTPRGTADRLRLLEGERFSAEGLRLSVGSIPIASVSGLSRPLQGSGLQWDTRVGFDDQLGLQLGLGAYLPLGEGISPGGSIDIFSERGVLFGPGARYDHARDDRRVAGSTDLAFIRDHGDRGGDVLGRPIDKDRFFWEWSHRQRSGDRWTINGDLNWWSDSAVLRDFRNELFNQDQEPDNFLEASWNGDDYILSALLRGRPNDFQLVPERLPEVRFDLLPRPVAATGALFELQTSAALLREKPLLGGPELRSDRFDVYAGLSRTFARRDGFTFTPVAGGRFTYYGRAENGRDDYARWLGELGFDARFRATSVREIKSSLWNIDGLRHVVEPRIEYRYLPSADAGRPFIPAIDRPAFITWQEPLGLARRRDIDALEPVHAVRLALDNILENRRADYGSRQLVQLNLATDFLIDDTSEATHDSDLHTELRLTPASWLDLWLFTRIDPEELTMHELSGRVMVVDGPAWSLGLDTDYLQHDIEQIQVFGRYELNEANEVYWAVRYDAREERFNEAQLGLYRHLTQNWVVRTGLTFRDGPRRESDFGIKLDLRFLAF